MSEVSARGLASSSLHMHAAQLAQMASRLVLIPMVISRLGLEGYGVWALLFSLSAYATALNTGIVWAYVKLTAELDQRGDYARMSAAVSSGALLTSIAAGAVLATIWLGRAAILPWIGVPEALLADAQVVLALLSAAVLIETGPGCALYVLAGLQRLDLQYRIVLAASFFEFTASVSLLASGQGLRSLAVGYLVGQIVAAGGAWTLCRRMRPALRLSPLRAGVTGVRSLMPLGFRLQAIVLLNTVARESIRLSLSVLFGASALGAYQLADRLLFVAKSPAGALLSPLMPAFSGLTAGGQLEKGRRLFGLASTLTLVAGAFTLLFTFAFADVILLAVTGRELPEAVWTLRVMAPAELAMLMTGVAVAALRAAGTVGLEARFALVVSGLALAGIAVGNPVAGYAGSIVALAIGRGAAAIWFLRRLPPSMAWSRRGSSRLLSLLVVPPVVLAAKAVSLASAPPSSRWEALAALAVLAVASAPVVGVTIWFSALSVEDRAALLSGARSG